VLDDNGKAVFEKLRKKRLEIARQKKIAPYMIFHDRTLIELAERLPQSREELSRISGVGDVKLEQYGEIFLKAIEDSQ
jgi:ATP-dependent DNA helicase RecQ